MTALCAFATALLFAGLMIDGWPGTALLVLALAGNIGWLVVTFVRWWKRAPEQHRRIVLTVTVMYGACWFTIRATAGSLAAWVLGFAAIGYVATVSGVLVTTGYLAAQHAKVAQHAIASGKIKEIEG